MLSEVGVNADVRYWLSQHQLEGAGARRASRRTDLVEEVAAGREF
jgi:hypothetical protein